MPACCCGVALTPVLLALVQGAAAADQLASPGETGSPSSGSGSLANGPLVEALLVIPWIVLNELDKLKHRSDASGLGGSRSTYARLALAHGAVLLACGQGRWSATACLWAGAPPAADALLGLFNFQPLL